MTAKFAASASRTARSWRLKTFSTWTCLNLCVHGYTGALYTRTGLVRIHEAVDHNKEYVRAGKASRKVHTNTLEGFFSVSFKRGTGTYQHCGEQHLDAIWLSSIFAPTTALRSALMTQCAPQRLSLSHHWQAPDHGGRQPKTIRQQTMAFIRWRKLLAAMKARLSVASFGGRRLGALLRLSNQVQGMALPSVRASHAVPRHFSMFEKWHFSQIDFRSTHAGFHKSKSLCSAKATILTRSRNIHGLCVGLNAACRSSPSYYSH